MKAITHWRPYLIWKEMPFTIYTDHCKASLGWVIQGGSRSQKGTQGRKREKGRERLGECLRWPHVRSADNGGRREERERECVCVNENLTVLVDRGNREARERDETRTREKE